MLNDKKKSTQVYVTELLKLSLMKQYCRWAFANISTEEYSKFNIETYEKNRGRGCLNMRKCKFSMGQNQVSRRVSVHRHNDTPTANIQWNSLGIQ